jgi:CRISPR-associated protein Cmr1
MFLAGADGQTPELRAPSIKGALRFWWRAMNGHLPLEELKERESEIFGGTDNRSKVTLRIKFDEDVALKRAVRGGDFLKRDKKVLVKGKMKDEYSKQGLAYLFYLFINEQQKNKKGFNVGEEFTITFSCKEDDNIALSNFCAAFWAFVYLGGIGSRARRGAGSIAITNVDDTKVSNTFKAQNQIKFLIAPNENLEAFLQSNLLTIVKTTNPENSSDITALYSTINKAPIYVSSITSNDWISALDLIGRSLFYLRTPKIDKNRDRRVFNLDTLDQKAAFGLPIGLRGGKNEKGESWTDNQFNFITAKKNIEAYSRRASPIWISIVLNPNTKKYHWVVVHLQGHFMPPEHTLFVETKNPTITYCDPKNSTKTPKVKYAFTKENPSLLNKFIKNLEAIAYKIQR